MVNMRNGYGKRPKSLGQFEINPTEMMFWMYCPVKFPDMDIFVVPTNIQNEFGEIIDWVQHNIYHKNKYVYITAKTLFCTPTNLGNRPGWHSDGFATDDINLIWCNDSPTEFAYAEKMEFTFSVEDDCETSLNKFEEFGKYKGGKSGEINTLYQLDEKVIHRVAPRKHSGMRSFLKISISDHKYNLVGNSKNHLLDYDWKMVPRGEERNHPCQDFENKSGTPSENNEK